MKRHNLKTAQPFAPAPVERQTASVHTQAHKTAPDERNFTVKEP